MSFNKILIPLDGSPYSDVAIEKGMELAKLAGAEITLFYVKDRSIYVQSMVGFNVDDIDGILEGEKNNIMATAKDKIAAAGIPFKELVSEGVPGREICSISSQYDLIIMGTAGRTGFKKVIMGSVTQYVVTGAQCPVMSVKTKD